MIVENTVCQSWADPRKPVSLMARLAAYRGRGGRDANQQVKNGRDAREVA